MGNYGTEWWERERLGKDSGARCVRNVLAAAAHRGVGGWMDGWWVEGERGPFELHGLQIVKELSGLQRSTVCFASSH